MVAGEVSPSPPPPACLLINQAQRLPRKTVDVLDKSDCSSEEGELTESTTKFSQNRESSARGSVSEHHGSSRSENQTDSVISGDDESIPRNRHRSKHKHRSHRHSRKHSNNRSSSKHSSSSRHGKSSISASGLHKRKHHESPNKISDRDNGVDGKSDVVEVVELSPERARVRKSPTSKGSRSSVLVDLTDSEAESSRPSKRHKSEETENNARPQSDFYESVTVQTPQSIGSHRKESRRSNECDSPRRSSSTLAKKSDKRRSPSRSRSLSRRVHDRVRKNDRSERKSSRRHRSSRSRSPHARERRSSRSRDKSSSDFDRALRDHHSRDRDRDRERSSNSGRRSGSRRAHDERGRFLSRSYRGACATVPVLLFVCFACEEEHYGGSLLVHHDSNLIW